METAKKRTATLNPELIAKATKNLNAKIAELRALPEDHEQVKKNKHLLVGSSVWIATGNFGIGADGSSYRAQASLDVWGSAPNVIIESTNSGYAAGIGVCSMGGWFYVSTSGIIGSCQVEIIGAADEEAGAVVLNVYSPSGNTTWGHFAGSLDGVGAFDITASGTIIRD